MWLLTYVEGTYVEGRRRWVRFTASGIGIALLVETGLITLQVVCGTSSHCNISTPFDAAIFSAMGAFITFLTLLHMLVALWLVRQPMRDRVFTWGLRLDLVVSLTGILVRFLMTGQITPEQTAAMEAGHPVSAGAHAVGVPGLPFLGWSTEGGDLRMAHFFGLHAVQILPFLGWS